MGFGFWTAGAPLCLFALGALVGVVMYPDVAYAQPLFVVGFVWLLLTGKARKTYWNARIRSRASYDARRARARAAD